MSVYALEQRAGTRYADTTNVARGDGGYYISVAYADSKTIGPMCSYFSSVYGTDDAGPWVSGWSNDLQHYPTYRHSYSWERWCNAANDGTYGTSWDGIPCADGIFSSRGVNKKVFAQRMSEFSMTVLNRYGSKTIIYDKTNVDQSKNNPCVFDFTQEMEIDDTKELVYRSDLDAYTSQQTADYNNKKATLDQNYTDFVAEMNGRFSTFTSDANTTIVQYENEMDKRYENSIGAVDRRETEHNTTLTNNLNSEISRAKSAESTLQSNIDTLTTNTTNNLNAYKEYVQDSYSKVKVVDHLDKCTEDNIIYLVDPTWNNDYEVQTYEDREIKNLTHD